MNRLVSNTKIISIISKHKNYASENYLFLWGAFKNLVIATILKLNTCILMKSGAKRTKLDLILVYSLLTEI